MSERVREMRNLGRMCSFSEKVFKSTRKVRNVRRECLKAPKKRGM